jgi:hypothetical protein
LSENGRPEATWRVAATEVINGTSCPRLEGVQQSEDWERGKVDRTAWRRLDTLWISPRTGVAQRVERRIEHRLAGREDANHVSVLRYDLQSALQYPVTLADDRRRELNQTLQLQQTARPLLTQSMRNGSQLDVLLARVKATHDTHAQTPYREALVHLRQRLEMARRGETPPALPSELRAPEPLEEPRGLTVGKAAPDFVVAELVNSAKTATLSKWRGRPVLLIFFNPDSRSLDEMMRSVQGLADRHKEITLVGLAMSVDAVKVSRLQESRGWKLPILAGTGLRNLYEIEHTPTLVFIDAAGQFQGSVVGWGMETPTAIRECLPRWLRR